MKVEVSRDWMRKKHQWKMWEFLKASKDKGGERVGQEGIKGQRDESEIERERESEEKRGISK